MTHLRAFGKTGLRIAPLALGTDNFANPTPRDESFAILDAALDAGINLIDTSNSYAKGEAERIIGAWLGQGGRRGRALIATKAYYPTGSGPNDRGGSRAHLMRACEDSLRRLGIETIDLYQTHRPDMDTPIEETLRALEDLRRQGKIRYAGSTTAPAWRVVEAAWMADQASFARMVSEQTPYNLLDRRAENELLPACQRYGLAVLTWSPLAMGMLAGRYADAAAPPADSRMALRGGIYAQRITAGAVEAGNRFAALAREAGWDPALLALCWVKDRPGVTAPLLGPRTLAQLRAALPALETAFPADLAAACDALVPPGHAEANFHNTAGWTRG